MSFYHPVAFSVANYTQTGSGRQYAVPFPFLSREHVSAFVAGLPVTFTWINDGLIELNALPAASASIRVSRITPAAVMLTVFSSPSNFRPENVNGAYNQLLYICQEAFDAVLGILALTAQIEIMYAAIVSMYTEILGLYDEIVDWHEEIRVIWDNATFDLVINIPFRSSGNRIVASFQADEQMVLLANLAGSRAWALGPPEAQSICHLEKLSADGLTTTPLTTLTWEADERNADLPVAFAQHTIAPGETLILRTSATTWDSSLRHWGITLRTRRYPPLI